MAKLQWNKMNKETREIIGEFAVAVWELEDKKSIYAQNLKKRTNCLNTDIEDLNKIEKGETTGILRTKSEIETSISSRTIEIENMKKVESALEKEIKSRMEKACGLVTDSLFNAYEKRADDDCAYDDEIGKFLSFHGVEPTASGIRVLRDVVGEKEVHGKKVVKDASTMGLVSHKKDAFARLFIKGIAREMVKSGCLKTDMYKFQFKDEK